MKKLFLGLLIMVSILINPTSAMAVVKESGDLKLEYSDPLFSSTIRWYPGRSETAEVIVSNKSMESDHLVGIKGSVTEDSNVTDILTLGIYEKGILLWGPKTLKEFSEDGEISLSSLGKGFSTTYDLLVSMDLSLGNDYRNKDAKLDFVFSFFGTSSEVSTAGDDSEGGGCSVAAPGSPINLIAVSGGVGQVILNWSPPILGTVTHYSVAYGSSSGNYLYGNPNVGQSSSYVVGGLSSGVSYYFVVQAINDCAPGPYSNEVSVLSGGATGEVVIEGPAQEFEVLGDQEGEVAGTITKKDDCFWWLLSSLLFTFASLTWLSKIKELKARHLLIPLIFSLLIILTDRFFHRWLTPGPWCSLIGVWALISFLLGLVSWWRRRA